jgi:transcriptional regulator with XRE-family HTH domain
MATDREDIRVLVVLLRTLRDWNQAQMATAVGIGNSEICRYERGSVVPPPAKLERLASAVGVPISLVNHVLLPTIHLARTASVVAPGAATTESCTRAPGAVSDAAAAALRDSLRSAVEATLTLFSTKLTETATDLDGGVFRTNSGPCVVPPHSPQQPPPH